MPRPTTLDPLGVFDPPHLVSDPVRQQEIKAGFVARLTYLERSYLSASKAAQANRSTFNDSLARLKRHIAQLDQGKTIAFEQCDETRLHPELELLINAKARELAGLEIGAVLEPKHRRFVNAAAAEVSATVRARRGRPNRYLLQYFVEALVALLVEVTGRPVIGQRSKDSLYSPGLNTPSGQVIRKFVDRVEPGASDTTLVNMIRSIRRKHAGKAMHFEDFFPFYGGSVGQGVLKPGPGYELEIFVPIHPIYCP